MKYGIYSSPWRGTYAGYVGGSSDNADGTYDWINKGDHDDTYRFGRAKKPGEKKTWGEFFFPIFYRPFPPETQKRVLAVAEKNGFDSACTATGKAASGLFLENICCTKYEGVP